MTDEPYRTGYKHPPVEHRFKPGRSGNPSGRPKGARSMPEEVRAALRKTVTVTEDGRRRKISVLEAALRRLVEQAVAKGELRAIQQILTLADTYGIETERAISSSDDQALIASALRRLAEGEENR